MSRRSRYFTRRMEKQGTHRQRIACLRGTDNGLAFGGKGGDSAGVPSSQLVGSGEDTERAIVRVAIVQVDSQCHHPFQQRDRGLNVNHSRLLRPRTPPRRLAAFLHGY